ncbi:hypothetical protein H6F89_31805 [Cyanobacteria bacterium FACHB-63]|nr:hypothetical protein [Cyanobacteria bacterium FACHB-63]
MGRENRLSFKNIKSFLLQKQAYRTDGLIVLILGIAIGVASYLGSQQIPDAIFTDLYSQDTWFGSDIPTVFGNMTSFQSDFGRNNKHPLFPLLALPPIFVIGKLFYLDPVTTVRLVIPFVAVAWIGLLFALFRLMGCARLDATLFSLVGESSAAAIFWFTVPESFSFGSVTILMALVLTALAQHRVLSPIWYVIVGIFTVGITITNWMAGIFSTIANYRWKKALQITFVTFVTVNALWIVQRSIFRSAGYPFSLKTFVGEKKFMTAPGEGSTLKAIAAFFYQTLVMPAVQFKDSTLRPGWTKPVVDTLTPGSGGFWGTIAVLAWTALLALGVWGFFSTKKHPKLRLVLGLTLLGQLAMHSVYGTGETFIYALHFAPLLLTIAAFSALTRLRSLALILAALLIVSAGINNRSQFAQVTAALINYGTPRQQVQAHMRVRPADHWPRAQGHVVLATPGTSDENKAYYEPAGSFSPVAGSFGVSIWVIDQNGNVKITSDEIPLNQVQQQLLDTTNQNPLGVLTKTEYYQASWSSPKLGIWNLSLKAPVDSTNRLAVVVRSVGPAGGAVKSLNWTGQQLLINERWTIQNLSTQAKVFLGSERSQDWTRQKATATQWQDETGWGYARLEMGSGSNWDVVIEDTRPALSAQSALTLTSAAPKPVLDLPDAQFVDSFNAQIAHLKMGLVGNQTRPGDPLDYALPRFRDGAYEMVALARTGQIEIAKQLGPFFAATDFLNGTQPEADIPALGIWALTTLAQQVNQPEYDRALWADIRRKAELIIDLISTNRPGYPVAERSQLPFSEHPDFFNLELVAGKMEGTPNLIAIDPAANLMSYRALLDAATLADRLKETEIANRWRSYATQLQTAWQKAFELRFATLGATYTQALWPSWIAIANQEPFVKALENRWTVAYDHQGSARQLPANGNLNLAEAHQWLYLNQPDRVWSTLRWFWDHQASPGLYTWWGKHDDPKGVRLPSSLSHWHRFRGWINPPHVTPHYWTAAEMLLLQLDMLAYIDPTANQPTLVIGAGIPRDWLAQPISVKGLPINGRLINWMWDGKQMSVQVRGQKMAVRLGQGFEKTAPIRIEMLTEPKQSEPD